TRSNRAPTADHEASIIERPRTGAIRTDGNLCFYRLGDVARAAVVLDDVRDIGDGRAGLVGDGVCHRRHRAAVAIQTALRSCAAFSPARPRQVDARVLDAVDLLRVLTVFDHLVGESA